MADCRNASMLGEGPENSNGKNTDPVNFPRLLRLGEMERSESETDQ